MPKITLTGGMAKRATNLFFSFAEFVDHSLHNHRWGYYGSGKVKFGKDFVTFSQSLSPVFGEMIAKLSFNLWQTKVLSKEIKENETFEIVEVGSGTGDLAHDVGKYVKDMAAKSAKWKKFMNIFKYRICERSSALMDIALAKNSRFMDMVQGELCDARALSHKISAKSLKGVILSNELLDSFAPHKIVFENNGGIKAVLCIPTVTSHGRHRLQQRGFQVRCYPLPKDFSPNSSETAYGLHKQSFLDMMGRIALSEKQKLQTLVNKHISFLEAYVDVRYLEALYEYINEYISDDQLLTSNKKPSTIYLSTDGVKYLSEIAKILHIGYVVTMDYGTDFQSILKNEKYSSIFTYGSLSRKVDLYSSLGSIDITSYVDFSTLIKAGERIGLKVQVYKPLRELALYTKVSLKNWRVKNKIFEKKLNRECQSYLEKCTFIDKKSGERLEGRLILDQLLPVCENFSVEELNTFILYCLTNNNFEIRGRCYENTDTNIQENLDRMYDDCEEEVGEVIKDFLDPASKFKLLIQEKANH